MVRRNDGLNRADKGVLRKYKNLEEKQAARREQRFRAQKKYRLNNKELLRERSKEYRLRDPKKCIERTRKWQMDNENRVKDYVYKRKYDITLMEYNKMVTERNGCCDICQRERKLVIDHYHKKNKVRGLLCDRCNVAIGCFAEDLKRMIRAIRYLGEKNGDPEYHDSWRDIERYTKLVADTLEKGA